MMFRHFFYLTCTIICWQWKHSTLCTRTTCVHHHRVLSIEWESWACPTSISNKILSKEGLWQTHHNSIGHEICSNRLCCRWCFWQWPTKNSRHCETDATTISDKCHQISTESITTGDETCAWIPSHVSLQDLCALTFDRSTQGCFRWDIIDNEEIDPQRIWFSDEAHFHVDGYINKQNWYIWGTKHHTLVCQFLFIRNTLLYGVLFRLLVGSGFMSLS